MDNSLFKKLTNVTIYITGEFEKFLKQMQMINSTYSIVRWQFFFAVFTKMFIVPTFHPHIQNLIVSEH